MKNFARIIDLGIADCCVHRRGTNDVVFDFWLLKEDRILSPSVTRKFLFPSWMMASIFSGAFDEVLRDVCQRTLDIVVHQMDLHEGQLQENVPLVLDGETLEKFFPRNEKKASPNSAL